jgi:hypothetical protein
VKIIYLVDKKYLWSVMVIFTIVMNPAIAAKRSEFKHKLKKHRVATIQYVARTATKRRKIDEIEKKQSIGTQANDAAKYISWETGDDVNGDIETFVGGHKSQTERANRAQIAADVDTARQEYVALTSHAHANIVFEEAEQEVPSPGPSFYL